MAKPSELVNTRVRQTASCQIGSVRVEEPLNANYANLANWDDFFGYAGRSGPGEATSSDSTQVSGVHSGDSVGISARFLRLALSRT